MKKRMPTLFLAHGSPMNAIETNSFTHFLQAFAKDLPRPKAILVVSAHWETDGVKVLKVERPITIHDFGGFPKALYEVRYSAPGSLAVADRVVEVVKKFQVQTDASWGLDHGAWSVLKHLYPLADIPVLQLSLNQKMTMAEHLALGAELGPLRDEGIFILGSGNITHNLRRVIWDENAPTIGWAAEFDEMIKRALISRDTATLLATDSEQHSLWQLAHPSFEHYLPLLYAFGASDQADSTKFVFEGMQNGSLSMRSVLFG